MSEVIAFVKENTWLTRGVMDFGWGNGYVAIPDGHPLYGMDYNEIHRQYDDTIDVNGGLTFSEQSDKKWWPEQPEGNWWVIGFDTAHSWDSLSMWPDAESVMREALKLKAQVESIRVKSATE